MSTTSVAILAAVLATGVVVSVWARAIGIRIAAYSCGRCGMQRIDILEAAGYDSLRVRSRRFVPPGSMFGATLEEHVCRPQGHKWEEKSPRP